VVAVDINVSGQGGADRLDTARTRASRVEMPLRCPSCGYIIGRVVVHSNGAITGLWFGVSQHVVIGQFAAEPPAALALLELHRDATAGC